MPSLEEQITWMYDGTDTRRFHGRRMVVGQTVGEHSLRLVLLLMLTRYRYLGPPDEDPYMSEQDLLLLVRHAAVHDLAEHMGTVGDIPAPAKRLHGIGAAYDGYERRMIAENCGIPADLPPHLAQRFKFVDCLDGMLTCVRERQLGNTTLYDMYSNYDTYIRDMENKTAVEIRMWLAVGKLWREANGTY